MWPRTERRRRRIRHLPVLLAATALLAGCTLLPGTATSPTPVASGSPSTGGSAEQPLGTPSSSASPTAGGRFVEPIPSVQPPGFVDPPAGEDVQAYLDQQVSWSPCAQNEVCATVSVPLDWSKPQGQAITLRLGKVEATGTPRLGTLFVNPGGPGGSGVALAAGFDRTGLEQYDIVGWDPRGAGESTPVVCENGEALDAYYATDVSPDSSAEDSALRRASRTFGLSCLAKSGALLAHISTLDTVKDLDFLRQLLGDKTLDYFGYSYGTYIGAVYASTYPKKVGRMVLDGAVNITTNGGVTQADGFERSLDDFASWCAQQSCQLGHSRKQVLATVSDLLTRLDQHPLKVGDRTLTQSLGMLGVIEPLYAGKVAYNYLEQAIGEARSGNGARLLQSSDRYTDRSPEGRYGPLLSSYTAITCSEDDTTYAQARVEAQRDAKQAPTLGPFMGIDYSCPAWPVAPEPDVGQLTGAGAAPIVVIGTTRDPATPYEYAESMAKQLTSGRLLTYVGEGHTAYGGKSRCIDTAVVDYLAGGHVPKAGKRCDS